MKIKVDEDSNFFIKLAKRIREIEGVKTYTVQMKYLFGEEEFAYVDAVKFLYSVIPSSNHVLNIFIGRLRSSKAICLSIKNHEEEPIVFKFFDICDLKKMTKHIKKEIKKAAKEVIRKEYEKWDRE